MKSGDMYFRFILISFIDVAIIRSFIPLKKDRLHRVPLQNLDHQKPNQRSKYVGFSSFKLVINKFLLQINLLSLSLHYTRKERFLNARS